MVLLLVLLVAAGVTLFAYQNSQSITLHFGYWTWVGVPLWYAVAAAAGAMFLVAMYWSWGQRGRGRRESRTLREAGGEHEELFADHAAAIDDLRWKVRSLEEELSRRRGARV